MVDRSLGFSLWLDFVEREYLQRDFGALIEQGVINGATSNPSIFAAAITSSPAYKAQLESLKEESPKAKYEALAIEDIRTAAKALRGVYDAGSDGYISIEVDPFLSKDTEGTVAEGRRLFEAIGEPNVMVKVPATHAGYEAMRQLLSEGISVNATLIFSPDQAKRTLKAMQEGIEIAHSHGKGRVNGVVSVFVSRFDRLLDSDLAGEGIEVSKTGIYNAAHIYNLIENAEVPHIRTLFASTGVKGDALEADYYIRELLASHSINTAPLATIDAYIKRPQGKVALPIEQSVIDGYFTKLSDNGFEMDEVYASLLEDGLKAFEEAFEQMLAALKGA